MVGMSETKPCPHCLGTGIVLADPPTRLRGARVSAGLSQSRLASRLDLSVTYVSDVERGTRSVSPERAAQWLAECGETTPWLNSGEEKSNERTADE